MSLKGKVKWFNGKKGYGFIEREDKEKDVFVHHSAVREAGLKYLNDVDDGGQTNFSHYGIKIKPETGKTLIWPAEWTHAHTGEILKSGKKYIVTGWIHFPIPDSSKKSSLTNLISFFS